MANSLSRNERLYLQNQTDPLVIPNTTGASTLAVANYCPHVKFSVQPINGTLYSKSKTGTRTARRGIAGRRYVTWSATIELIGAASAALPPSAPLWRALFGGAGSTAAGVTTFSLSDDVLTFAAALFRLPSTLQQRLIYGAVVRSATITLGQDVAEATFSGEGIAQLDQDTFAGETTAIKASLTAFPTEPAGSLPSDSGILAGFTGEVSIGGTVYSNIRSATIQVNTGNELVKENFGEFTPTETEGDERLVTCAFDLNDKDTSAMRTLYTAFRDKSPVDIGITLGTATYNRWKFSLESVQLQTTELDDSSRRFVRRYSDCRATGSAPGALDELKLEIS